MKLLMDGLEKKDGFFEMPFEGYGILGDDENKVYILGDDIDGNYEIAQKIEDGENPRTRYMIFETPKNYRYITITPCFDINIFSGDKNFISFVSKNDVDKIELLAIENKLDENNILKTRYILKIKLLSPDDYVNICFFDAKANSEKIYRYSVSGVKEECVEYFDRSDYIQLNYINYYKMDKKLDSCIPD